MDGSLPAILLTITMKYQRDFRQQLFRELCVYDRGELISHLNQAPGHFLQQQRADLQFNSGLIFAASSSGRKPV